MWSKDRVAEEHSDPYVLLPFTPGQVIILPLWLVKFQTLSFFNRSLKVQLISNNKGEIKTRRSFLKHIQCSVLSTRNSLLCFALILSDIYSLNVYLFGHFRATCLVTWFQDINDKVKANRILV